MILIVEDEKLLRWTLSEQLKRKGHDVSAAGNLAEAAAQLEKSLPEVLLLDLSLPDGHGLDFYQAHAGELEDTAVIVMTAVGQIEDAVRAMKLGARDFLNKPVDQQELLGLIDRSLAARGERLEARAARRHRERDLKQELVGDSAAFRELLEVARKVAESDVNSILIQGETGSGKNVLARHIHHLSARRQKPILEVSCAAIPDSLLESELLGHERGAFTDAKSRRQGVFELADGGSVVLDEIGELKQELQAKLLHVLEERRLRRVGGAREIHVDVQVVALTIRDLASMVRDRQFREDLFFRLAIFPITVPPLRERPEDILPLARHFLSHLGAKRGSRLEGFTRAAENRLLGYSWPGNIRELRNVIERAMVLEQGPRLTPESLLLHSPATTEPHGSGAEETAPERDSGIIERIVPLAELERGMVERAMRAAGGNQTRAAELLGVTRDQLRYRLQKFDL